MPRLPAAAHSLLMRRLAALGPKVRLRPASTTATALFLQGPATRARVGFSSKNEGYLEADRQTSRAELFPIFTKLKKLTSSLPCRRRKASWAAVGCVASAADCSTPAASANRREGAGGVAGCVASAADCSTPAASANRREGGVGGGRVRGLGRRLINACCLSHQEGGGSLCSGRVGREQ